MARTAERKKNIGVYRLHNYAAGRAGEPFSMCDEHAASYNPPFLQNGEGRLQKIASNSLMPCEMCEETEEES